MGNINLHNIAAFGLDSWAETIASHNLGRRTAGLMTILRGIMNDVREGLSHFGKDTHLTKEGQNAAKAKLGAEAQDRIAKVESEVQTIVEWTDKLAAGIRPQFLEPSTEALGFLAEREVRDLIREQPDADRIGTLFTAIEEGDTLTIRAFMLAPKAFLLTSPDIMDQAMKLLAERGNPEKVEVHKAAIEGLMALKNGVRSAKNEVGQLTGISTDPLAAVAAA